MTKIWFVIKVALTCVFAFPFYLLGLMCSLVYMAFQSGWNWEKIK